MTILDLYMFHSLADKRFKNGCVKVFVCGAFNCGYTKKLGYRGLKSLINSGAIIGFEQSSFRYRLLDNKIEVVR
jgi:hypothetical protein